MDGLKVIGNNIKRLRIENNMSQEDLAFALGYKSRSSIAKIESGGNNLPQSKIVQIADILGTTPAVIMGWSKEAQDKGFSLDYTDYSLMHGYLQETFLEDSETIEEILIRLHCLNSDGINKILERVQELLCLEKYCKQKVSSNNSK